VSDQEQALCQVRPKRGRQVLARADIGPDNRKYGRREQADVAASVIARKLGVRIWHGDGLFAADEDAMALSAGLAGRSIAFVRSRRFAWMAVMAVVMPVLVPATRDRGASRRVRGVSVVPAATHEHMGSQGHGGAKGDQRAHRTAKEGICPIV
jgi:hypothetical protein